MKARLVIGLISVFGTLAVVSGGAALVAVERFQQPGPLGAETTVRISRGASLDAIAKSLEGAGVVDDAFGFKLGVRVVGAARDLRAGEYAFPAEVSMRGALDILARGETVAHGLTVAEGLTSTEIVALVAAADGMSGEPGPIPPEGALLPETYHYAWEDSRAELVARMQQAQAEAIAELWPKRAEGLPIQTPEEAVILASIVEKETGVADERPLVASVFINRLKRRMRLQSDPTVVYALTNGQGPLGRALTTRDLAVDNPYNTYARGGLPPGPIANPGRAALEAVLNPADTKLLYFVADGTGGHAFAKSLVEHNRNVAKWRKIQRNQGQSQKSN